MAMFTIFVLGIFLGVAIGVGVPIMWRRPSPAPKHVIGVSTRMTGTIGDDGRITDVRVESMETVKPTKPWPRGTPAPKWSEPP